MGSDTGGGRGLQPENGQEKARVSGCPSHMGGFAPVFEVALSFSFSAEKPGMMFKLGAPVFGANLVYIVA